MTRLISSLAVVAGEYDALYCDLWGCVHDGQTPFPAAVAALRAFRAAGKAVMLVTNAPRPRPAVRRILARMALPEDTWDDITSSGDAAQYALATGAVGRRVWHIGTDKDLSFFDELASDMPDASGIQRVAPEDAEGIVCTGLFDDMTETPEDYRGRLMLARERGQTMLCANPDIVVDFGTRRIYCAGALARLYEEIGGKALYFGKPHPPVYDLAARRLTALLGHEVPRDRILAIGDGIGTDITGAAGEGIDAIFVTGGIAAAEFGPDPQRPDPARLAEWLAAQGMAPRFAIPFLR
jgi:HAD superfamily hydrolase (TIGR01459 family)